MSKRTFFIELERQGWTLAIVKVEAETLEEATNKALRTIHSSDDIGEISLERAREFDGIIIDENGVETDID